jgi:putative FmdB family regulatory protein
MPTYEYECEACGHEMEAFQSMTEEHLKKCPECGKNGLKRKIGMGAGIIFKGSGFYETDYKNKNSESKSDKSSKSGENATNSKSKTDGASEAKSETKKEVKSSGETKKSDKSGGGNEKK